MLGARWRDSASKEVQSHGVREGDVRCGMAMCDSDVRVVELQAQESPKGCCFLKPTLDLLAGVC